MLGCTCHVPDNHVQWVQHRPHVVSTFYCVSSIKLPVKLTIAQTVRPDERTGVARQCLHVSILHLEFASPCDLSLPSDAAYWHHSTDAPNKRWGVALSHHYEMHVEGDAKHT